MADFVKNPGAPSGQPLTPGTNTGVDEASDERVRKSPPEKLQREYPARGPYEEKERIDQQNREEIDENLKY